MKWYRNLYMGEKARKKRKNIIYNIDRNKPKLGVYVLTLAANGVDLLDVIPAFMLDSEGYKGRTIEILGIASGKDEAFEVARDIIDDVYEKTGGYDVRGYFS